MFGEVRHKDRQVEDHGHRDWRVNSPGRWFGMALPLLAAALAGCGAHRPLSGIPVHQLPEEWRHPVTYRSGRQMIDLTLLRQTPPAEHRVDAGDVLGIYIDGILGGEGQIASPPVYTPQDAALPPAMGFPVTVRGDGSISLPGCGSIHVRGLTLQQVEDRIREVGSRGERPLLQDGIDQIIVSLQRPRVSRVLVIRQEAGNDATVGLQPGDVTANREKRGAGRVVTLPAYRNDVLHALTETGGLPGLDAENVVYIIRGSQSRPPAVAPPPAPVERSVRRDAVRRPAGLRAVHSSDRRHRTSPIQLAGGFIQDPFANPFEPPASDTAEHQLEMWPSAPQPDRTDDTPLPLWQPEGVEPQRTEPEGLEPGGVEPEDVRVAEGLPQRVSDIPRPVLPPPLRLPSPSGHSSDEDRLPANPEQSHVDRPLPPLPAEDAVWDPVQTRMSPTDAPVTGQGWSGEMIEAGPIGGTRIICIPLKILPGEPLHFCRDDIILHDGDVVLVESREQDFFMTGGLLGGGQFPLPRDYDITVIDAIAMVEQASSNRTLPTRALGGVSALNQDVTVGASKVVILRKLPDGCEVPIEIDLYDAIRDPHQRIVVQAGDRIILQYTRLEAIGAFFERHILDGAIIGLSSAAVFSN